MSLHASSLSECENEPLKNCSLKASSSASKSENRQVTRFTILIPHPDCCVRINHRSDGLFNGDIHAVIDILIATAEMSKVLYSWLFIDPSEHHHITQTSKFNSVLNRASTM